MNPGIVNYSNSIYGIAKRPVPSTAELNVHGMMFIPYPNNTRAAHLWLLAAALFALCSCSPELVKSGSPLDVSAELSDSLFTTRDGSRLPMRKWLPAGPLDGVIIGVHGLNDYSNFIKDGARYFNDRGLAVYAYDQRGFGATTTKGRWSGKETLADDLAAFIKLVKAAHPEAPLYVLGDSMGGAVTIVTMVACRPEEVAAIILVSPAVWARTEMPLYQRFALWLSAHTIPWMKFSGKTLDVVASDNTEMLREMGRDPLVIKETRVEVLYGLANLMDQAYASAGQLHGNALVLYGQKDEIIPRVPVMSFYQRLPGRTDGTQQLILYENGYHMLLRDLQATVVFADIIDWISSRTNAAVTMQRGTASTVLN